MRLEDESAAVWEAYPEAYVDLAAVVTDLGGATGLVLALALVYWLTRGRERAATVAGYTVIAVGVIMLMKYWLAMPRPPAEVYAIPLEDDPYGFPSGHAFMAVVVYGGLAAAYDRLDDPVTVVGVGALVVAISISRVVLGLHYLSDILVGAALGIALLAGLLVALPDDPRYGFGLGIGVTVPAVVVSGGEPYALVGLGAGIGGLLAWSWLESPPERRSRGEGTLVSVLGLGFLVSVGTLESAVVGESAVGIVAVNAVLVAGILLAPAVVGRLRDGGLSTPLGGDTS